MLTKEEVDAFMTEADVVRMRIFLFLSIVTHRMGMGSWTRMSLSR